MKVWPIFEIVRRVLTYLFLFTMVLYTFSQAIIVADFLLNQAEIAATLCENKDKPEMKCNGKCHLMKELNKDEERKTDESGVITIREIFLFNPSAEIEVVHAPCFHLEKQTPLTKYQRTLCLGIHGDVFHPPTTII